MPTLPIVWVPGHLCGPWLYAPQLARFGEGAIIADTASDDTIRAMAGRLLDGAPERFVIVGLSMGGMVAMEAMAAAPERIAGAVLMDTDPGEAREKEIAWRGGLLDRAEAEGMEAYAGAFVPKFFAHDAGVAEDLGPMVEHLASAMPLDIVRAQARALDRRREMVPLIEGFGPPVEVLAGGADRICPPRLHGPIAAACADAVLTELPGVGHLATLEAPEAVNARIAALLERADAG